MPDLPFSLPIGRSSLALAAVLLVAGCTGATSPQPSGSPATASGSPAASSPSSAPQSTPATSVTGIDHPTGATDVVLRLEQGGGFAPMEMTASNAPIFTLYGNGVIVFQPKVETLPEPDATGVSHGVAWRTAKLDETQIRDLLEFAIGPGGLGTARDAYMEGGIADAPSTIFSIHAGGLDKSVVVTALLEGGAQGPDAAARNAFAQLSARLRDFDQGGSIPTDVYQPDRFRGVLLDREGAPADPSIPWPWPAVKVGDFVGDASGNGGVSFPHRTLTQADVDALGVKDTAGGLQGLVLKAPNGKTYGLIVRPLLADEPA